MPSGNTDFTYRNLAFNMIWLMVNQKNELDNVLRDKAFKITSDPKYDGYQRGLTSMIY